MIWKFFVFFAFYTGKSLRGPNLHFLLYILQKGKHPIERERQVHGLPSVMMLPGLPYQMLDFP